MSLNSLRGDVADPEREDDPRPSSVGELLNALPGDSEHGRDVGLGQSLLAERMNCASTQGGGVLQGGPALLLACPGADHVVLDFLWEFVANLRANSHEDPPPMW